MQLCKMLMEVTVIIFTLIYEYKTQDFINSYTKHQQHKPETAVIPSTFSKKNKKQFPRVFDTSVNPMITRFRGTKHHRTYLFQFFPQVHFISFTKKNSYHKHNKKNKK